MRDGHFVEILHVDHLGVEFLLFLEAAVDDSYDFLDIFIGKSIYVLLGELLDLFLD